MTRVCTDWWPVVRDENGKVVKRHYKGQRESGFYMDNWLKNQIDIMVKNIVDDWDFTILISAGGEVRVGKSLLAQQIAAYWIYAMQKFHGIYVPFDMKNIIFIGEELVRAGNEIGQKHHYSPIIYDEAGETLEGVRSMSTETKQVMAYLRECGQYNFLNILVLPEYFSLPRSVALTRSICLIDVYYTADKEGKFQRGSFKFFSRKQKKKLYLNGKKTLNYNAAPHNFTGKFYKFYPIDEDAYRKKKIVALRAREKPAAKEQILLSMLWHYLMDKHAFKTKDIVEAYERYNTSINPSKIRRAYKFINERLLIQWEQEKEKEDAIRKQLEDDDKAGKLDPIVKEALELTKS